MKILVVDDDSTMRDMLVEQLADHGIAATSVNGVDAALEHIAEVRISLVLSDVQMPRRDGFDLLAVLRDHRPPVPVVLMSAFAHAATRQRALDEGAHDFLSKPFGQRELLETIRRFARR